MAEAQLFGGGSGRMTDPSALDYSDPAYCDHSGQDYHDDEGRVFCANCDAQMAYDDWSG